MSRSRLVVAALLTVLVLLTPGADGAPEPALAATSPGGSASGTSASPSTTPSTALSTTPSTEAGGPGCRARRDVEVCFSSPASHGGTHPVVINRMRRLFDSAGAGDSLRIAMFRWDIRGAAEDLVAAQQRGARVELVVDADVLANPVGAGLVRRIEDGDPAAGNTVVCDGACLPWAAPGPAPVAQDINHLKLVLADVGGEQSVVTTSSNLAGLQYRQYNSLLRIVDPGYYRFAGAWFAALKAQRWGGARSTLSSPTAAVYPRRGDLLASTLGKVRCTRGLDTVHVHLAVISRADIRSRLVRLHRAGCDVRVVVDRPPVERWLEQAVPLPGGGRGRLPEAAVRQESTHDKAVVIHALVGGRPRYVVVTGTSNATCGGLHYNDEIMLRLSGKWIHDRYDRHFKDAFRHGRNSSSGLPSYPPCR